MFFTKIKSISNLVKKIRKVSRFTKFQAAKKLEGQFSVREAMSLIPNQ